MQLGNERSQDSGFGPNYSQIIRASFRASDSCLMLDYVHVINFSSSSSCYYYYKVELGYFMLCDT